MRPQPRLEYRAIADSHGEDFYSGDLATRIVTFAEQTGGLLAASDLADHRSQWVEPISARYRDHEVCPPLVGIDRLLQKQRRHGTLNEERLRKLEVDAQKVPHRWVD